jgi:AcrR family transcriptional regulator
MKQEAISAATRISILDAANQVILEKGAQALTLDAVAQKASVSKGGLLYHFPSKKKLIEGMIERLISGVEAGLEQEQAKNGGDYLAAFIYAFSESDPQWNEVSCALMAAIANEPDLLAPLQKRYRQWQAQVTAVSPSPEVATLIRLALDGLWIADLLDFAPPAPEVRKGMLDLLLSMVHKDLS